MNAINTLGAGDMYAGAYLYATTQNIAPEESALFANEASAKIVTKSGPRLSIQEAQNLKIFFANNTTAKITNATT